MAKQRIVFVNLHSNVFYVKNMSTFIYKLSVATKHRYFLDYLINNPDIEVCNFINDRGFSMVRNMSPKSMDIINKLFKIYDHWFVMYKNGLWGKVKAITNVKDIRKDDIVISYIHDLRDMRELEKIDATKAIGVIHINGTKKESDILMNANPTVLFNEFNVVDHSKVFKRNFSWYKGKCITYPFVYASRFQNKVPLADRERKAFSPGTITYIKQPEFLEVYGDYCMQPARKQILDHAKELEPYVACYNSEYLEDFKPVVVSKKIPKFIRIFVGIYNMRHMGQQKKYFSFDMVERYNHFKMFISGEEATGNPGVGFVEGMACGAAYIGNKNIGCYEDYGMKEGVHYIGYDGTLEDLKSKIEYYQRDENQEELERIAKNGYEFALRNFNANSVSRFFLSNLIDISNHNK